jgi:hypothetical protein
MTEQRINTIESRVEHLSDTVLRVDQKLDNIADTLQSLVRIEERQLSINEKLNEANASLKSQESRLRALELSVPENLSKRLSKMETVLPGLQEVRKWIIMGIVSGVGLIGAGMLKLVMV